MSSADSQKREDAVSTTRGQHARRFAQIGMLVGAVVGLGGGFAGVIKLAFLGGITGAAAGGVAGNKLAPLADKIAGFLPGRRKAKNQEVSSPAVQQQKVSVPQAAQTRGYSDVGSIDPEVLAELREGISGAVTKVKTGANAEEGMLKEGGVTPGGWVDAVSNKRPTHPAHLTYQ